MGVRDTTRKYGYPWWERKFDWSVWALNPDHAKNFLVEQGKFSQRFTERATQVSHVDVAFELAGYVNEWLGHAGLQEAERDYIFHFAIGLIVIQWRIDIWSQIITTDHADPTAKDVLLSGRVALSDSNVRQYVTRDPYELLSSNRVFYKNDPDKLLEYFFGVATPYTFQQGGKSQTKLRNNWDKRPFRLLFKQVYEFIIRRFPPDVAEDWKAQLYKILHATNPLLPVPDGTQLIQRGKNITDRQTGQPILRGYCWAGWDFTHGLGPLGRPVTVAEILDYTYSPSRSRSTVRYTNPATPSVGIPPQLSWEQDFLGHEPGRVKEQVDIELRKLSSPR